MPIPDDLLKQLRKYRAAHPKRRLITGTAPDTPNRKLLLSLKRRVRQAGLNCGVCKPWVRRSGPSLCGLARAEAWSPAPRFRHRAKPETVDVRSTRAGSLQATVATGNPSSPRIKGRPPHGAVHTCADALRHDGPIGVASTTAPTSPTSHRSRPTGEELSGQPHHHPPGAGRANPRCSRRPAKNGRVNPTESRPDLTDPAVSQGVG